MTLKNQLLRNFGIDLEKIPDKKWKIIRDQATGIQ